MLHQVSSARYIKMRLAEDENRCFRIDLKRLYRKNMELEKKLENALKYGK